MNAFLAHIWVWLCLSKCVCWISSNLTPSFHVPGSLSFLMLTFLLPVKLRLNSYLVMSHFLAFCTPSKTLYVSLWRVNVTHLITQFSSCDFPKFITARYCAKSPAAFRLSAKRAFSNASFATRNEFLHMWLLLVRHHSQPAIVNWYGKSSRKVISFGGEWQEFGAGKNKIFRNPYNGSIRHSWA